MGYSKFWIKVKKPDGLTEVVSRKGHNWVMAAAILEALGYVVLDDNPFDPNSKTPFYRTGADDDG